MTAQRLVYAVGDLHGRSDLLKAAARRVTAHVRDRSAQVVFLGDYVDRGPDSKDVIDRLMAARLDGGVICLKGNHEAMMVSALYSDDEAAGSLWLKHGGEETLRSYGKSVPRGHLDWMDQLPWMWCDAHRAYVHAGLMPDVELADQTEDACLWIRQKFLRARPDRFPRHVVHGHTSVWDKKPDPERPELLEHRTNLDTQAFSTGVLTIGVFDRDRPGGPIDLLTVC